MPFLKKFIDSSRELNKVHSLAVCAMMLAVNIVLGIFSKFALPIMPFVKIGFMFIPIMLTAHLYGPVCAAIVSAGGDILSTLLNNTTPFAFNPGITACCILEGIIYGLVLYENKLDIKRAIMAKAAVLILCHLPLNSAVLCGIMGLPYTTMLLYRAAVLIPFAVIEVLIITALSRVTERIKK